MTAPHDMHVVICTHGRAALLGRTLESFAQLERPASFAALWVIENGSDDGARDVCARHQNNLPLRYVHLPAPGKSKALTHAIEAIGRGLVIFTDDDVRFGADFLSAYARAAEKHGQRAVYGGPLLIDYDPPSFSPPAWLRAQLPPSAAGWQLPGDDAPIEKACFLGANYAAFAERIIDAGGFNTALGVGETGNPVGEEFDIQDRLIARGCRGVYLPDAKVWHFVPEARCTPQWLLDRTERIWFTNGLEDGKTHHGPTLFGAPRWMWRKLIALRLRALTACCGNEQTRFEKRKAYRQHKGYLRGIRRKAGR